MSGTILVPNPEVDGRKIAIAPSQYKDINPANLNLALRLQNDDDFRFKLKSLTDEVVLREATERDPIKRKKCRSHFHQQVWKLSERNSSLLMPWFFPKYPRRDPFDIRQRPFNMILLFKFVYSTIVFRGSRQVGKTTTLGTDMRVDADLFSNFSQLYVAPHSNPLETFARKFSEMEKSFRFPVTGSKYKQNQYYKNYPNGSEIDMQRVMTSATPIRGKSADAIKLDEAQLMDPGLEMEVLEVLNDSKIKSYVMAGTATTTDTLLETSFQEGCQAVWHIHHPNGKKIINCGDPEDVIPYIGEYRMEDPVTKEAIDPLNGFYQFMNPDGFRERIVSVHVPQIINPDKINNKLEWNGIHKSIIRDRRKAIQEKLGIPLEEGNREVTTADMKNICVIPDGIDERIRKCRTGYYRSIVSAFDWGGSDYNTNMKTKISTTCHAILGVSPDDKIHILHGRRHGGANYHKIINDIVLDHVRFNAGALCSDFGGGHTYHMLLRSHPKVNPSRHVIFDYDDPEAPMCATPTNSQMPNMLMLNKTDSLTNTFMAIVSAEPYLLAPSWDEFGDLLVDFLNNHRVMSEKANKGRRFLYHRHGSKPDDFLHAVNFGMALLRLHYNQALVADVGARNMIRGAMQGGGSQGNGWASALSSYSRGEEEFD